MYRMCKKKRIKQFNPRLKTAIDFNISPTFVVEIRYIHSFTV